METLPLPKVLLSRMIFLFLFGGICDHSLQGNNKNIPWIFHPLSIIKHPVIFSREWLRFHYPSQKVPLDLGRPLRIRGTVSIFTYIWMVDFYFIDVGTYIPVPWILWVGIHLKYTVVPNTNISSYTFAEASASAVQRNGSPGRVAVGFAQLGWGWGKWLVVFFVGLEKGFLTQKKTSSWVIRYSIDCRLCCCFFILIILMFESCLFQQLTKLVGVEGIASVFILLA